MEQKLTALEDLYLQQTMIYRDMCDLATRVDILANKLIDESELKAVQTGQTEDCSEHQPGYLGRLQILLEDQRNVLGRLNNKLVKLENII